MGDTVYLYASGIFDAEATGLITKLGNHYPGAPGGGTAIYGLYRYVPL